MLNKKQTSLANLFKFDLAKALDGLEYPVSLPEVALMLEVKKNNYYALRLRIEELERLGVLVADGIRKGYPCYWVYSQAEVDKAKYITFCERVGKSPPVDESEPLPDGFTSFPSEKEAEPEKPKKIKKAVPDGVETRLSALEQNLSKLTTLMETLAQSLAGSKPQEAIQQTLPSVPPIPVPPIPVPPIPVPPIPVPPPTLQQLEEEFFGYQPKPRLTALQSLNFEEIWASRHDSPNWDEARPWLLLAQTETFQEPYTPAKGWQAIWFRADEEPPNPLKQHFFPDDKKQQQPATPKPSVKPELNWQMNEPTPPPTAAEKWDAERKRTLPGLPSNPPPWVKEHDPLLGYWHDSDNRMALIQGDEYPQWDAEAEQYVPGKKPWPLYPAGRPFGWAWDMPTPPQRGISFTRRTIHKRDFVDPFNKPGYQPWRLEDKYIPEEWKLENRPKD